MNVSNSVSWMIPCSEVLYFASSLFDNQLLTSAILFLIHFQLIPYFNTKAVEPGLTVNSHTQDLLLSNYSNGVRVLTSGSSSSLTVRPYEKIHFTVKPDFLIQKFWTILFSPLTCKDDCKVAI